MSCVSRVSLREIAFGCGVHANTVQQRDQARAGLVFDAAFSRNPRTDRAGRAWQGGAIPRRLPRILRAVGSHHGRRSTQSLHIARRLMRLLPRAPISSAHPSAIRSTRAVRTCWRGRRLSSSRPSSSGLDLASSAAERARISALPCVRAGLPVQANVNKPRAGSPGKRAESPTSAVVLFMQSS